MKTFIAKILFSNLFFILALTACAARHHAESAELKEGAELTTLHTGTLHVPSSPDAPLRIYMDAPDNRNLARYLGHELNDSRFKLVSAPSEAGYILHVKVLAEGDVAPDTLKKAVDAGYGAKTAFHGQGARAILADALMVQRRVPEGKRPSRKKMKNISARNALASAQMRLAVSASGTAENTDAFNKAIAVELAKRIRE